MIERRKMLQGLLATASSSALMQSVRIPTASAQGMSQLGASFGGLPPSDRDQGMGATDASGFVAHFPLRPQGAKQVWVNTATGSPSFNGLSPYPGYELNGAGPNYQVGATGPGAPNGAFGPKNT